MISDVYHYWGNDLTAGNTGDLLLVQGTELGQQRVLRRLLTNPGDYVFEPTYGAGLPAWVGQPFDAAKIGALIRSQMLLESCVAQLPPPSVTVAVSSSDPSAIDVTISYQDANSDQPVVLSFSVSN